MTLRISGKSDHSRPLAIFGIVLVLSFSTLSVLPPLANAPDEDTGREIYPSPTYFLLGRAGLAREPGLANYKPGRDNRNVTFLENSGSLNFTLNLIGKDYDEEVGINLLLCMNSVDRPGKIVHVRLLFDYNNDGKTDATVNFPTYETKNTFDAENFTFFPTNRTGDLEDFRGLENEEGNAPGGTVTLRLWRTDSQSSSKMLIYCGAYNSASRLRLPYYRSIPEGEGGEDGEEGGSTNPIVEILLVVALAMAVILILLKAGGKKKK